MLPKLVRTLTSVLPIDDSRSGQCNNCGECCKLPFRCAFLKTAMDGRSYCSIYRFRPPSCRKFPRTEAQFHLVKEVCGFAFENTDKKGTGRFITKDWKRFKSWPR